MLGWSRSCIYYNVSKQVYIKYGHRQHIFVNFQVIDVENIFGRWSNQISNETRMNRNSSQSLQNSVSPEYFTKNLVNSSKLLFFFFFFLLWSKHSEHRKNTRCRNIVGGERDFVCTSVFLLQPRGFTSNLRSPS